MSRRKPPKPLLYPMIPVDPSEKIRGADGRPIKLGVVVRRVRHVGSLGVEVEVRRGRVVEMYRRTHGGPVTVRFRGSDEFAQGIFSAHPEHVKRSAARVEITGEE